MFLNGFAPSIKCRYIHTHLGRQYCVPHVSSWRFWDRQNSNASAKTTFLIAFFGHQVLTGTVRHVFYVQIGNATIPCKTQVIRGDTIKNPLNCVRIVIVILTQFNTLETSMSSITYVLQRILASAMIRACVR